MNTQREDWQYNTSGARRAPEILAARVNSPINKQRPY